MGQTAAQVEADVERRRHALEARVSRLERRVREDVEGAKRWRTERIEGVKASVHEVESDAVEKAKDTLGTDVGSGTKVAEHPLALVAGSAVTGFALGLKTGGPEKAESSGHREHGLSVPGTCGIVTLVSETIRAVVGAQTGALVETALDAGTSGLKSAVTEITGIGAGVALHNIADDDEPSADRGGRDREEQPVPGRAADERWAPHSPQLARIV